MEICDFLCAKGDEEELQKFLNEETDLFKMYVMEVGGLTFRRHIAKMDETTGLPKYLANQRIRFSGASPVKNAYWKVEDGK